MKTAKRTPVPNGHTKTPADRPAADRPGPSPEIVAATSAGGAGLVQVVEYLRHTIAEAEAWLDDSHGTGDCRCGYCTHRGGIKAEKARRRVELWLDEAMQHFANLDRLAPRVPPWAEPGGAG